MKRSRSEHFFETPRGGRIYFVSRTDKMFNSDEISSTPIRLHRDFLTSSPDNRFSSPSLFSINSWTPVRTPLWPGSARDGGGGTEASSPSSRFVSFTTPGSLDLTPGQDSSLRGDSCKRGRPRADLINHLIHQGSSSPNGIKCKVCGRVFPREKSLQVNNNLNPSHQNLFFLISVSNQIHPNQSLIFLHIGLY